MSSSVADQILDAFRKSPTSTSSRRSSGSHSDPHVAAIVGDIEEQWEKSHAVVKVRPGTVPAILSRPVGCQTTWASGSSALAETSVDFVPCVVIPNMPTSQYPRHMKALIGYTLAATAVKNPHMALAMSKAKMLHLVAVTTAVRAGAWSALNVLPRPEAQTHISALHWSTRSARLYVKAATIGDGSDLWRFFHGFLSARMLGETELALALCVLSPLFLQMGASSLTQSGEAYATQYVERAISSVLKARLKPEVYANANLASKATWQALREAPLTGMCVSAVRAWASDPLLSAGANYRMATREAEAKHWEDREHAILEGAAGSTPAIPEDTAASSDDFFRSQFSALSTANKDDDEMSMVDTVFGDETGLSSPSAEVAPRTQVPTPGDVTPVRVEAKREISAGDAQLIRDNVAAAHTGGALAPSLFAGVADDETVLF